MQTSPRHDSPCIYLKGLNHNLVLHQVLLFTNRFTAVTIINTSPRCITLARIAVARRVFIYTGGHNNAGATPTATIHSLVTFHAQKYTAAEQNHGTYDDELLVVESSNCDHKNFTTTKPPLRRQARWSKLRFQDRTLGREKNPADRPSRRPGYFYRTAWRNPGSPKAR